MVTLHDPALLCRKPALALTYVLMWCASAVLSAEAPKPPEQPASVPGGKEYAHAEAKRWQFGAGATSYWVFTPAEPESRKAPLVVFIHGWSAYYPVIYGDWVRHIARRGNIVIFPRYQLLPTDNPRPFLANTVFAVKDALARLEAGKLGVRPDVEKVAVVGHSLGGMLTARLAVAAAEEGIPQPGALMVVQPGGVWGGAGWLRKLGDPKTVPPSTLLLAVVGDQDRVVGDSAAKRIFNAARQIPAGNKDFVTVVSDARGDPPLLATHTSPTSISDAGFWAGARRNLGADEAKDKEGVAGGARGVNALDYYAYWKLFDALCDCAFFGRNREYALGGGEEQVFMGKWSDGRPVSRLVVTDEP